METNILPLSLLKLGAAGQIRGVCRSKPCPFKASRLPRKWGIPFQNLSFAAELDDAAAVALGGAALGEGGELLHGLAFGGEVEAGCLALFGFAIEGLGDGSGAAHVAELEDFNVELAALVADDKVVAHMDLAGGLGLDAVGVNAAQLAGLLGQGAGPEEAGGPEPLVDAHGGHDRLSHWSGCQRDKFSGDRISIRVQPSRHRGNRRHWRWPLPAL